MSEACWKQLRDRDDALAGKGLACVVDFYAQRLDALLHRFGLQESDRKNVMSVCWRKVWSYRMTIRPGTEEAWLFKVAENEFKTLRRQQGRQPLLLIDPEELESMVALDCGQGCDPNELQASVKSPVHRVRELIDELDAADLRILNAWCNGDPANWRVEVACELGITTNKVGVRFVRLKNRIKKTLEDEGLF